MLPILPVVACFLGWVSVLLAPDAGPATDWVPQVSLLRPGRRGRVKKQNPPLRCAPVGMTDLPGGKAGAARASDFGNKSGGQDGSEYQTILPIRNAAQSNAVRRRAAACRSRHRVHDSRQSSAPDPAGQTESRRERRSWPYTGTARRRDTSNALRTRCNPPA